MVVFSHVPNSKCSVEEFCLLCRKNSVNFVEDFFEDAKRRDFTINALYLDYRGEIHDYFNGLDDLQNRKVRFILDAKSRIQEDYL